VSYCLERHSQFHHVERREATNFAVLRRRGRAKDKVAVARRLLVRLYVMLRDQIDYAEFCARSLAHRLTAGTCSA
jgi:hypothetical protein